MYTNFQENRVKTQVMTVLTSLFANKMYARRTRSFSVARMLSSSSARMNKLDFTTEKIGSVHITVFEIVAHRNVDNWTQLLK